METDGWPEVLRETVVVADLAREHARVVRERRVPVREIEGFEIVREVKVRVWGINDGSPGRLSGHPDTWYPPEPAEIEADGVMDDGTVIELDADELAEVRWMVGEGEPDDPSL